MYRFGKENLKRNYFEIFYRVCCKTLNMKYVSVRLIWSHIIMTKTIRYIFLVIMAAVFSENAMGQQSSDEQALDSDAQTTQAEPEELIASEERKNLQHKLRSAPTVGFEGFIGELHFILDEKKAVKHAIAKEREKLAGERERIDNMREEMKRLKEEMNNLRMNMEEDIQRLELLLQLKSNQEEEDKRIMELVQIVRSMRAREAAGLLDKMEPRISARAISMIPKSFAAEVMGALPPDKSAEIASIMIHISEQEN